MSRSLHFCMFTHTAHPLIIIIYSVLSCRYTCITIPIRNTSGEYCMHRKDKMEAKVIVLMSETSGGTEREKENANFDEPWGTNFKS